MFHGQVHPERAENISKRSRSSRENETRARPAWQTDAGVREVRKRLGCVSFLRVFVLGWLKGETKRKAEIHLAGSPTN